MLIGVPLGLLMGLNKYVNFLLKPLFSILLPLPTLAWVPILLIVFGMGDITIVIAIFLGGFFSITYTTATGVRGIDNDLIRAAQTMGASRWVMFSRILLPGSMVSVIAGLRLAVGYSWRALVGAEMLAAAGEGVGSFIFMARQFSAVDDMFAGLTIIMVAGLIMERFLIEPLEKRTVRRWGMMRE
jgi:NitT/TauT family transport system permease protein